MTPKEELAALAECALHAQKAVEAARKLWEGHPRYPHQDIPVFDAARVFAGVAFGAMRAACEPAVLLEVCSEKGTP